MSKILIGDEKTINNFVDDVSSLWCPTSSSQIDILHEPPTSMIFLQNYVSRNVPCIIRNAITTMKKDCGIVEEKKVPLSLTLDDIVQIYEEEEEKEEEERVTVDVTPDGMGDSIRTVVSFNDDDDNNKDDDDDDTIPSIFSNKNQHKRKKKKKKKKRMFVKPEERQMTFSQFRTFLRKKQKQQQQKSKGNQQKIVELDINGNAIYPLFVPQNNGNHIINNNNNNNNNDHDESIDFVVYYSRQNDCLRSTELKPLYQHLQKTTNIITTKTTKTTNTALINNESLDFAQTAFGTGLPDAMNLWIGNECVTSSMHKDHYENLFYVCSGQKIFTLCPPCDVPFLYESEFEEGRFYYHQKDDDEKMKKTDENHSTIKNNYHGQWTVRPDKTTTNKIKWIEPDIDYHYHHHYSSSSSSSSSTTKTIIDTKYPLLQKAHPIQITVSAGEMLYLPSLWFHKVTQTCETVAINYWYDMKFDSPLWCYFNLLQQLQWHPNNNSNNDNSEVEEEEDDEEGG